MRQVRSAKSCPLRTDATGKVERSASSALPVGSRHSMLPIPSQFPEGDRMPKGGQVSPLELCYPEVKTTGYSRADGSIEFYGRVNALLKPHFVILDFGAGRGVAAEDPVAYRRSLRILRGKVREVIGIDVDEAVFNNATLDHAKVMKAGAKLPLPDASIDLILSDHTFEHLDDPSSTSMEFYRVLRPGGWLCARTPNKWGYIAIGARLVPNGLHRRVLAQLQPNRQDRDIFPTFYKLNTFAALQKCFSPESWCHVVYAHNSEPTYAGDSLGLWRFTQLVSRVTPDILGATLLVFLQKKTLSLATVADRAQGDFPRADTEAR